MSARGMYEAYARNKYDALGITTWKYDAAIGQTESTMPIYDGSY